MHDGVFLHGVLGCVLPMTLVLFIAVLMWFDLYVAGIIG